MKILNQYSEVFHWREADTTCFVYIYQTSEENAKHIFTYIETKQWVILKDDEEAREEVYDPISKALNKGGSVNLILIGKDIKSVQIRSSEHLT